MTDYEERKALIQRVLAQFYRRDATKLEPVWIQGTEGLKTPQLRVACDEICAQWTKAKPPQPGNLLEFVEKRSAARAGDAVSGDTNLSLAELEARARKWIEAQHLPVTPANVMRRVRSQIGIGHPLAPLSPDGWREALDAGVVTHIPKRQDTADHAACLQLGELGKAGYGWCDAQRGFRMFADAVDLDTPAERDGLPYPSRTMTLGAIAGAHAALQRGELERVARAPVPESPDFERAQFEAREAMMFD